MEPFPFQDACNPTRDSAAVVVIRQMILQLPSITWEAAEELFSRVCRQKIISQLDGLTCRIMIKLFCLFILLAVIFLDTFLKC